MERREIQYIWSHNAVRPVMSLLEQRSRKHRCTFGTGSSNTPPSMSLQRMRWQCWQPCQQCRPMAFESSSINRGLEAQVVMFRKGCARGGGRGGRDDNLGERRRLQHTPGKLLATIMSANRVGESLHQPATVDPKRLFGGVRSEASVYSESSAHEISTINAVVWLAVHPPTHQIRLSSWTEIAAPNSSTELDRNRGA